MDLKRIFGKNVKYYRYEKNLTQEKFAELVDLYPSYISDLETGKYGTTFENIEKISKVLNIEPYILFQETNNTNKKLPPRVDLK